MIVIDGSAGGGQVLRTAIGMSALSGKSVEITNIRSNRPRPGLQAQHLASLRCVSKLCNAEIEGASLGSTTVRFVPANIQGGSFEFDIGTAGSITLVLQAALLPAAFAPKPVTLKITGGTDVAWSPPIDYLRNVLVPALSPFCQIRVNVSRRGYYPTGGGCVEVKVTPSLSRSAEPDWQRFVSVVGAKVPRLERKMRGTLIALKGIAHASANLSSKRAAERMADAARLTLSPLRIPLDITTEYPATSCTGGGIVLWGVFSENGEIDNTSTRIGASALIDGPSVEKVGERAGAELLELIRNEHPIDTYLADQLVPWLSLAGSGELRTAPTDHVRTNVAVVEAFLGKRLTLGPESLKRA